MVFFPTKGKGEAKTKALIRSGLRGIMNVGGDRQAGIFSLGKWISEIGRGFSKMFHNLSQTP